MRAMYSANRGSVNIGTLLALLITLTVLPLAVTVFRHAAGLDFDYDQVNSEMALMDLRRVLFLAYDLKVYDNELEFIYHNDDYHLRLVNGRLILQPGTQIYLNDIEEVRFYTRNGSLYLAYRTSRGKEYERNIGKENGIHLDDFPADNDELAEPDPGDE